MTLERNGFGLPVVVGYTTGPAEPSNGIMEPYIELDSVLDDNGGDVETTKDEEKQIIESIFSSLEE